MTYLGLHQSSNQRVDQTRLQSFGLSGPGCSSPFNKPPGLSVEVLANLFHRFLSAQSRLLPTPPQIPVCTVEVIANPSNKPSDLSVEVLANPFHRFLSAQSRLLPTSSTNRLICQSRLLPTPPTNRLVCQPRFFKPNTMHAPVHPHAM
jgi:hypothetical protein